MQLARVQIVECGAPSSRSQRLQLEQASCSKTAADMKLSLLPKVTFSLFILFAVRPFVSKAEGSHEELMIRKDEHGAEDVAVKAREQQIIDLNHKLITSATAGDFETYCKLVDPQVTSFEPVSRGNLVEGLQFHKFYFDNVLRKRATPINWTILSPRVHMLGDDAACICYVRLQQFINSDGVPLTRQSEETRVWQKQSGQWVVVHFHKSNETNNPSS